MLVAVVLVVTTVVMVVLVVAPQAEIRQAMLVNKELQTVVAVLVVDIIRPA